MFKSHCFAQMRVTVSWSADSGGTSCIRTARAPIVAPSFTAIHSPTSSLDAAWIERIGAKTNNPAMSVPFKTIGLRPCGYMAHMGSPLPPTRNAAEVVLTGKDCPCPGHLSGQVRSMHFRRSRWRRNFELARGSTSLVRDLGQIYRPDNCSARDLRKGIRPTRTAARL